MTETRTGPLGCSNYDNLDSVSSVLVHSPENKVHLQGETLTYIYASHSRPEYLTDIASPKTSIVTMGPHTVQQSGSAP